MNYLTLIVRLQEFVDQEFAPVEFRTYSDNFLEWTLSGVYQPSYRFLSKAL